MGREDGLSEEKVLSIADPAAEIYDDLERLVIEYAACLTRTPADASDQLVDDLRKHLDDSQLVELTACIAWENFRARFNRGFDVGAQGYSEAAVCAIPEHAPG